MTSPEVRHYVVSGEVPAEDWSLALQVLGRLGLDTTAVSASDIQEVTASDVLMPGEIPYGLDGITSRDQYLANEHLGEFWPEYRKQVQESGKIPDKSEALCWGLNMLTHPRNRDGSFVKTPSQPARIADRLALKIVKPRSLAGFSDQYSPRAYGLWDHPKYGDTVLEVGSFIDVSRLLTELPVEKRPFGVSATNVRFFNALADKLEAQIEAATHQ